MCGSSPALTAEGNSAKCWSITALVFGILGVQLFAGRFASCSSNDPTVAKMQTTETCIAAGGDWRNPEMGSFDNIGAAVLLLAMGYDALSMNATNLTKVKKALRNLTLAEAESLLADVMGLDDSELINKRLEAFLVEKGLSAFIHARMD